MTGNGQWRCLLVAGICLLLSSCNHGSAPNPSPSQVLPPSPGGEGPPPTASPPPPKGVPRGEDPASTLAPGIDTGSSLNGESAGANPVFADLGPRAPLKYRDVDSISLAISYHRSKDELQAYLASELDPEDLKKGKARATTGELANAPAGKYAFLMAKIESCLLLICDTHDDGIRSVGDDPMVWQWAITPEHNEGGNTIVIVGIYGSNSQNGPWLKVDAIPDIRERARIESRSWFLDNWDKALSMLGALLAFLFTHWLRGGGKKED